MQGKIQGREGGASARGKAKDFLLRFPSFGEEKKCDPRPRPLQPLSSFPRKKKASLSRARALPEFPSLSLSRFLQFGANHLNSFDADVSGTGQQQQRSQRDDECFLSSPSSSGIDNSVVVGHAFFVVVAIFTSRFRFSSPLSGALSSRRQAPRSPFISGAAQVSIEGIQREKERYCQFSRRHDSGTNC